MRRIGSKTMNAIYAKAGIVGGIGVGKNFAADKMKNWAHYHCFTNPEKNGPIV